MSAQPHNSALEEPFSAGDAVNAVLASFLGWALDAFDFFVLVFAVPAIARDFGTDIKAIAFTITVTLAFRPVGAFIFGLMADRYGRRLPLMIDLVFYSIVEVASGFAPTYTWFLVLRALFGIGMGGEWGIGASLAMEKVPVRWRGVFSGLLQGGYSVGYLLAALCYFFVFPTWGWRPMFWIGGLPALLALFIRFGVKESAVWEKKKHATWGDLGRGIAGQWRIFLYMTGLMTMMIFLSHGTQDMYPTFLKVQRGFDPKEVAKIAMVYNVGALLGGISFGFFSDRFGRKRAMLAGILLAILMIPLWAYARSTPLLVVGAFFMQFMIQGAWGVIPAHLSELSPDSVRGFLPGFAYQCGVLLGGSVAYIEAFLAEHVSFSHAMAGTAVTTFVVAAIVVAFGPERHSARFGEDHA